MNTSNYKNYIFVAGTLALAAVSFAAIAFGYTTFQSLKNPNLQSATISVSGKGEVTALPDIATITMTVRESAKTVPEAQKLAEDKMTTVLAALKKLAIEEKDTKTVSYTINPKYESSYCNGYIACAPQVSSPKVIGYEIAQTTEIKVRDIDQAGPVVAALGDASVTELSGPYFTVDDMDAAQAEARAKAIADAKAKAKKIASDLGVSLGAITQFYENNNGGYYPMEARMDSTMNMAGAKLQTVALPQGESVINSSVTITYSLD